ncbi:hypothetical protein D9M72_515720 [compost metagenome]
MDVLEQLRDLLGLRHPLLVRVLVEELARGVLGLLEAAEGLAGLDGQLIGGADRVVHHRVEVDVGEVQALFGTVVDPLPCQVAVQVHLAQADGVALVVAAGDGRHRGDVGHVRNSRERADGRLDGQAEVRRIHGLRDVQRAQVAGDVLAGLVVGQVIVVRGGLRNLEDLGAQVGHDDLAVDRVLAVNGVLEHDVRVAGFELDLG